MDPTEKAKLGTTDVGVGRLGLGGVGIGGMFAPVEQEEAVATVKAAIAGGVTFLDTAPVYGYGNAEQALGEAVVELPRESLTIATKVGRLLRAEGRAEEEDDMVLYEGEQLYRGTPPVRPFWDFSYDGVLRSMEESLDRLGLDRVDILHIHDPDDHLDEAADGCYRALANLRDEGVVGAIGAGANSDLTLVSMLERVQLDCVLVAGRYSLMDQSALRGLLPRCERDHVSVIVGGVYNSGLLCHPDPRNALEADRGADSIEGWKDSLTFDYTPASSERMAAAADLKDICDRHRVPLMAAAIQFPLSHPAVAAVLMGPRDRAEVAQNLEMFRFDIPDQLWSELAGSGLIDAEAPVLR